jgi:hypothetical protein
MPTTFDDLPFAERMVHINEGWQHAAVGQYNIFPNIGVERDAAMFERQMNEARQRMQSHQAQTTAQMHQDRISMGLTAEFCREHPNHPDCVRLQAIADAAADRERLLQLAMNQQGNEFIVGGMGAMGGWAGRTFNMTIPSSELRSGVINNNRRIVDIRTVLPENEVLEFLRIARLYEFVIRRDHAGDGRIGASRVDGGPAQHEGTDFVRRVGDPIPALFSGQVIAPMQVMQSGLRGITIKNDNGTVAHYMYVQPVGGLAPGSRVRAGDIIGNQQNLHMNQNYRNANVPPHLHFELWSGDRRSAGNIISTEGLFD